VYDHVLDVRMWWWLERRPAEVDCRTLKAVWPFVRRRRWTDAVGIQRVTETLWAAGGQQALRRITLVDQCRAVKQLPKMSS